MQNLNREVFLLKWRSTLEIRQGLVIDTNDHMKIGNSLSPNQTKAFTVSLIIFALMQIWTNMQYIMSDAGPARTLAFAL